jgi:hypothetical protein
VSNLGRTSVPQYAVISVRRLPRCERLVIAYPDEKTLRGLIAGPSIVTLGYNSREEAEASVYGCANTAQPSQRRSIENLVANIARSLKKIASRYLRAKDALFQAETQSAIGGLVQQVFAAAVVVLYSKNLLSTAIRAFISC